MPRHARTIRAVLAAVTVLAVTVPAAAASASQPARAGGAERISTSARIAVTAFAGGTENAVVATSADYPDALSAASLAGALGAPVLLTQPDRLSAASSAALERLGVDNVYVLGGESALSDAIDGGLSGFDSARLAGGDRYETAAIIARETVKLRGGVGESGGRTTVLIASGETFADALTSSPVAYTGGHPVLLVTAGGIPESTAAALAELDPEAAVLLGGEQAIPPAVQTQIEGLGIDVTRAGGLTRFDTAERFAELSVQRFGQSAGAAIVTRGDTFPDALSGGPFGGTLSAPVLLAESPTVLGDPATRYLTEACGEVGVVQALGGTAAVSDQVLATAVRASTDC